MARTDRRVTVEPPGARAPGGEPSATATDGAPTGTGAERLLAAPETADTSLAPAVAPPPSRRRSSDWYLPALGIVIAVLLFEFVPRSGLVDRDFFPPASAMFAALLEQAGSSTFWLAVGDTLQGWAAGLGIALLITIPLGILIGSVPLLFMATRSIVEFLRPIPSVALIPLAVLVFGAGMESKVFLAAFAATWPLLLQTLYGVRDVDPVSIETARSFGIKASTRLLRVTLPSALPYIATGIRISSSVALILAVTAELVLGAPGLGRDINIARQSGAVDNMYALILATGLLGWVLNILIAQGERRVLRWHPSHRESSR